MVIGRSSAVTQMKAVAGRYTPTGDVSQAIVQDFHSVRQALNVASADQRVLVLISGSKTETEPLRTSLQSVTNDRRILGRFHFDFDESSEWKKQVKGLQPGPGIVVIRPGEFGLDGSVMNTLPLDADSSRIISTLLAANMEFAKTTEKKVYSTHVTKGRQLGIYFESLVPYGEDRDGDGVVDRRGGGGGRRGPSGRRPPR